MLCNVYCLYFQMCIENKNSIPLQNQTKSEYYGHDPQLQCKYLIIIFQLKVKCLFKIITNYIILFNEI